MSIGNCLLVAIEGAPGSGKTTTSMALTSKFRSNGVLADYCDESARKNPLVEDFTIHGANLTVHTELQIFAQTLSDQILAARATELLVCDKTPASLLAYARVLLGEVSQSEAKTLEAMNELFTEWIPSYDALFILEDRYENPDADKVRAKVSKLSDIVHAEILNLIQDSPATYIKVPTRLSLEERVDWMFRRTQALRTT